MRISKLSHYQIISLKYPTGRWKVLPLKKTFHRGIATWEREGHYEIAAEQPNICCTYAHAPPLKPQRGGTKVAVRCTL